MKRLCLLLVLFASFTASGQVRLGAMTGLQLTNISRYDLVTSSNVSNFYVGVIADYRLSRSSFYIMGQALYGPMGFQNSNIQANDKEGNQLGDIRLHNIRYVQVPLYFLYGADIKSAKLKAGLGPSVSFKTGDKLKIKDGDTFGNGVALPLYTKRINPVLFGIGLHASIEWSSVLFSFHALKSLNGLYENQTAVGLKWRLMGFGFSIGYFFTK